MDKVRSGGHRVFIFVGKNFVMRRKRVLVTCPRFTESEEVQLSYVGGRGRGGHVVIWYLVLYYQSLALTLLKIGVSDRRLL